MLVSPAATNTSSLLSDGQCEGETCTAISGVGVTGYGYGLNVRDNACYGNGSYTMGAGTLRKGSFVSSGGSPAGWAGSFTFPYTAAGPSIICGDSGGPTIGSHGVHALDDHTNRITTDTAPGPCASSMMEGFYISPASASSKNLHRRVDDVMYLETTTWGTALVYNPVSKTIRHEHEDGTQCLDWDSSLNAFVMATCNTARPRQTWEVTSRSYIRNPASNLCMRHMLDGWVEMRTCPASTAAQSERARFTWVWHPQK